MRDKHHVLVVNCAPRSTLEHTLECAGYHVSWAEHTAAALQRLARERIDAVILDGESVVSNAAAWVLRQQWPQAAVLLMVEPGADTAVQMATAAGWELLHKPVTTRRLKQYLERMLAPGVLSMLVRSPWYEPRRRSASAGVARSR